MSPLQLLGGRSIHWLDTCSHAPQKHDWDLLFIDWEATDFLTLSDMALEIVF